MWEHIYWNVLPHQLTVGPDFKVASEFTRWTGRVGKRYQRALMPTMEDSEQEEFGRFQSLKEELASQESAENISEDTLKSMGIDEALMEERSYSLSDWGRFSMGGVRLVVPPRILQNCKADHAGLAPILEMELGPQTGSLPLARLRPIERDGSEYLHQTTKTCEIWQKGLPTATQTGGNLEARRVRPLPLRRGDDTARALAHSQKAAIRQNRLNPP